MSNENTHVWDRTIATFGHPRYEVPDGKIVDDRKAVIAYWHEEREFILDQRNELMSLEIADGSRTLLRFYLRGIQ